MYCYSILLLVTVPNNYYFNVTIVIELLNTFTENSNIPNGRKTERHTILMCIYILPVIIIVIIESVGVN